MTAPVVCAVARQTPKEVIHAASRLARDLDCRLELVHIAEKPAWLGSRDEPDRRGRELLTEMRCEVPATVETEVRLEHGEPAEALIEVCTELGARLLVVGSPKASGSSPAQRSRTHRLLAYGADSPLMIVPPAVSKRSLAQLEAGAVVCGVGSSRASLREVRLAVDLAEQLDRRLVLVDPGGRRSLLTRALAEAPGSGVVVVEADPSAQALEDVARAYDADFVMGGHHGASVPANFSRRSTASRLVLRGERPVVVLPKGAALHRTPSSEPVQSLAEAA